MTYMRPRHHQSSGQCPHDTPILQRQRKVQESEIISGYLWSPRALTPGFYLFTVVAPIFRDAPCGLSSFPGSNIPASYERGRGERLEHRDPGWLLGQGSHRPLHLSCLHLTHRLCDSGAATYTD